MTSPTPTPVPILPPAPTNPAEWVYRVDVRNEYVIFREGFRPYGANRSLIDHIRSSAAYRPLIRDGFVSFTDDWDTALRIANARQTSEGPSRTVYIYAVRANGTFFSMNETMLRWDRELQARVDELQALVNAQRPGAEDYDTARARRNTMDDLFQRFSWQREWARYGPVSPSRIFGRTIFRGVGTRTASPWDPSRQDVVGNDQFAYDGYGSSRPYADRPLDFVPGTDLTTYSGLATATWIASALGISVVGCVIPRSNPRPGRDIATKAGPPVCPAGMRVGSAVEMYDGQLFRLRQRTKAGKELVLSVKASDHGKTGPVTLEPSDGTGRQVWHVASILESDNSGRWWFGLAYDNKILTAERTGGPQASIYSAQDNKDTVDWRFLPGRGGTVMIENNHSRKGQVLKRVSEESSELEFVTPTQARPEDLSLLEWNVDVIQADRLPTWTDGYQVRMVTRETLKGPKKYLFYADSKTVPGANTTVGLYPKDDLWPQMWRIRPASGGLTNLYAIGVQKESVYPVEPYAMAPVVEIKDPQKDAEITTPYWSSRYVGNGNLMKWRAVRDIEHADSYYFVNLASGMYLTETSTRKDDPSSGVLVQRKRDRKLRQSWYIEKR